MTKQSLVEIATSILNYPCRMGYRRIHRVDGHVTASALKSSGTGPSTLFTATAQGSVTYYTTHIVGQTTQRHFAQGRSWGSPGPKRMAEKILDSVDRDSIPKRAREDIRIPIRKNIPSSI